MVVGKYKKPNREKGDSKGYKLLNQANQDSQSDKVLNEVICDSQDDEIPNEKTEDTKSYQIDKKEKVKKLCKRKCIILIAVCVMFLLTSVVITFKITNKGTSVFSTNCSTPPDVTSSSYEISGTYTVYKCHRGFYPIGESTIVCQDGAWTSVKFNCSKYCGSPPNVPYSTHKTKSNMSGAVTTYRCLNGYVPVGETNIYCKANGEWSSTDLKCLKDCGRPPPIYHSNSFYQSTYTNSKVIYYCTSGYRRIGSPIATCQSDGKWTRSFFYCKYVETNSASDIQNKRNLSFTLVICIVVLLLF